MTFRRHLADSEGLILLGGSETRVGSAIHMFFVFFPIAVVWLDREGRVIDRCLAKPFRPFYAPRRPARDIIEGHPEILDSVHDGDRLCLRSD
ncbi:MAG: hypothetical protein GX620_16585 [Chloroflexi bacterium]|nr:hypothetical protein [Chloroflexota bacterium]